MQVITNFQSNHRAVHRRRARLLLCIIYISWFVALALGSLHYAGEPIVVKRHELPLRHVDNMFRRLGGALIFGAWALRATLKQALHLSGDTRAQHIWVPAAVYAAQAIVRSIMYEFHRLGIIFSPRKWTSLARHTALEHLHQPHAMSDHVLLAAAVVGGLALEVVVLHLSVARMQYHRSPVLLRGLAVVMTMFAVLVSAECYYTAKYFHPPTEILVGAVVGILIFQAPLLFFSAQLMRAHAADDGDGDEWEEEEEEEERSIEERRPRVVAMKVD